MVLLDLQYMYVYVRPSKWVLDDYNIRAIMFEIKIYSIMYNMNYSFTQFLNIQLCKLKIRNAFYTFIKVSIN